MNTARINYVAAGGFVAVFLIGVVISIALLTGRTGSTDTYHSVYKNITGVKFGTLILYEGYPIGQVEEVIPEAASGAMLFRVNYTVQEGWKIPDDSLARIGSSGLLSAITINIDAGNSKNPHKPGALVEGREAADLFAVVGEMAGEVTNIAENDIRPLLNTINKTVESLSGTISTVGVLVDQDGTRMIKTFAKLADQLNEHIPGITQNVDISMKNFAVLSKDLAETTAKLDRLLGDNQGDVRKSIEDLRHVTSSLARYIDSVNQNVEGTARNMYEFSREIRKNPGLLLSGGAPKDKGGK